MHGLTPIHIHDNRAAAYLGVCRLNLIDPLPGLVDSALGIRISEKDVAVAQIVRHLALGRFRLQCPVDPQNAPDELHPEILIPRCPHRTQDERPRCVKTKRHRHFEHQHLDLFVICH